MGSGRGIRGRGCKIWFNDLDQEARECSKTTGTNTENRMPKNDTVLQENWLSRLAFKKGLFRDSIWNDSDNAFLKKERSHPQCHVRHTTLDKLTGERTGATFSILSEACGEDP